MTAASRPRRARATLAPATTLVLAAALAVVAATSACARSDATPGPPPSPTFDLGEPQVVFRYQTDRCDDLDLPDMTARAVRLPDGTIALYSGNAPAAYASFGPDFDTLTRSCIPTLVSVDDPTPETFLNQSWLSTVYRDGDAFHAIVHNEFHDPIHPNCKPGDTSPANPCWYNTLTYAASRDGRTFQQPAPDHVLAGPPQPWDPTGPRAPGPYGYFAPSNILLREDGRHYAMFFAIPDRDDPPRRGSCVMRTDDLADPAAWRAWDGAAFTLRMPSPYDPDATGEACTIVLPGGIEGSLTYNTYLRRYLYVGASGWIIDGTLTCGSLYSLSEDLIRWTPPRVLKAAPTPIPPCPSSTNIGREYYPTLIDHDAPGVNFETSGRTPHLYYMRYNDQALDRDLVRVPVVIHRQGE